MLPSDSAINLTKDGIDNMVGRLQSAWEVVDERDLQVFKLLGQPLVKLVLAAFGVVDGGLVAIVSEVTSGYQAIASVISRAASHEDAVSLIEWVHFVDGLGYGKTSKLHQLVDGKSATAHELLVESSSGLGRESLESHDEERST